MLQFGYALRLMGEVKENPSFPVNFSLKPATAAYILPATTKHTSSQSRRPRAAL
jgi:hypothetical protein